jgi:hypothetical protein
MPSQNTKWYKDVQLIQYLDQLRLRNLGFMSKCYFCGAKSIGIKAIEEKLFAVCSEHEYQEKAGESVKSPYASSHNGQ